MFKKYLLKISSLLVIGLMVASPALAASPTDTDKHGKDADDNTVRPVIGTGNTGPLALPASGMGSLVFINYDGGSEELDITLGGMLYKIPPSTNGGNGVWNQVEISLAPGSYSYTASVAGNDTVVNNTIDVVAGKVTGIGFYDNLPDVLGGDKGSDDKTPEGNAPGIGEQHRLAHDFDDLLFGVSDMTALAH